MHRVVLEENRTVLVVDVDKAGDHDEDEEAEDWDDHNLNRQFIRKYYNMWPEQSQFEWTDNVI